MYKIKRSISTPFVITELATRPAQATPTAHSFKTLFTPSNPDVQSNEDNRLTKISRLFSLHAIVSGRWSGLNGLHSQRGLDGSWSRNRLRRVLHHHLWAAGHSASKGHWRWVSDWLHAWLHSRLHAWLHLHVLLLRHVSLLRHHHLRCHLLLLWWDDDDDLLGVCVIVVVASAGAGGG